ncbi:MAG: exodeoxyribonuclease V subunit beta [Tepidimonas taiwanensis]|nr:exodeoxyribonuclease V subunit beta [Tepidimonas taiwanensis]
MSADLPELDVLTLPLQGCQLIEASAGSGKTWTMALLAVRLVLGTPAGEAGPPPLSPQQILVVTYTDAATQELRSRIQARLLQAAAVFGGETLDALDAAVERLLALRARYTPAEWPKLARRLTAAADALDEAPISTLHGWCQRILREQALLSGEPFQPRVLQDTAALRREVVRDWWRLHVLPLDEADAAQVLDCWKTPDELDKAIQGLLEYAELWTAQDPGLPTRGLAEVLRQAESTRARVLAALKAPWPAWIDEAETVLARHGLIRHVSRQQPTVSRWFDKLRHWALNPQSSDPGLKTTDAYKRLTLEHLRGSAGSLPPEVEALPLLRELPQLEARLAALPGIHGALMRHVAVWVAQRMRAQLRAAEQLTFDEMLRRVDEALAGPQGTALAERLRQQQPVALVDEFQDTDPRQWRILQAIYRPERPPPGTALLLIGDPKQAIYAFRHADIHSYLQARAACAGRIWSLAVNHRSSKAMVRAVNALFGDAERTLPDGAFGFARDGVQPVPFLPAQPHGQPECWRDDEAESAAALICALWRPEADKPSRTDVLERLAAACAATVARWLTGSAAGRCGFERDGRLRPVQPQDLAILVNDSKEAQAIARALRRQGLASAYRSEKTSVWEGPDADDLQAWLHACAHPHDRDAIAHALLTPALGLDGAALATLLRDEDAWDTTLARFARYHALWQRQGVLAAVRALMHDFGVAARLLARPADHPSPGARALADLLHMAEWLQQAARQRSRTGVEATLALLRLARLEGAAPSAASDDPTQTGVERRLDGTPQAIPVITVHKAKGLQFPLVLLPFAGRARPLDRKNGPQALRWHDDAGHAHVTLPDEGERWLLALARAEHERLREDTRKLYVALTRAVHLTWVGVALEPGLASSALARLLGLEGADAATLAQQVPRRLQALAAASGGTITCTGLSADDEPPAARGKAGTVLAAPALPAAHVARPRSGPIWWIASYSALARAAHGTPASADAATEAHVGDDDPGATGSGAAGPGEAAPAAAPWHRWPRGAQPGVALHALLEACHRRGWPAGAPALKPLALRTLQALGWAPERLQTDASDLADWGHAIGEAALPLLRGDPGVRLRDLAHAEPEVPFWLRIDAAAEARELDRLLLTHIASGQPRPTLAAVTLHGMLKGFMDLVFEHDGRYWVLDHKSNALGSDDAAYHPAAVQAEVLRQRYDAQAALYLLALHRWLAQRLGTAYDPTRHLGGALCVFWRGVAAPGAGVWHLAEPWPLVRRLEALFMGAEVTA